MALTKRVKIATGGAVALLVALAIGIRWLQLLPYPRGEFNWLESPNERHRAYFHKLTDKGFFGGTRELYRITVEMGMEDGRRFQIFEEDIPATDVTVPVDLGNLEQIITWARNSYAVTYDLGERKVEVVVPF